jgi:hypothetical protein
MSGDSAASICFTSTILADHSVRPLRVREHDPVPCAMRRSRSSGQTRIVDSASFARERCVDAVDEIEDERAQRKHARKSAPKQVRRCFLFDAL